MKTGKLQVWQSPRDKQWRWRAIASNGNLVAECGEGYKTKRACLAGLASATRILTRSAPGA